MSKRLVLLVGVLFAPVAAAQDPAAPFTAADFEAFLKSGLKLEIETYDNPNGKSYELVGTPFYATFNEKGKYINFSVLHPKTRFKTEPTLEKLNEWNRKAIYSRAFLATGNNDVKYEAVLSFADGITPGQIKSFYERFDKEHTDFGKHFGGIKPPPPETSGPPEAVRIGFPASAFDAEHPLRSDTGWDIQWDIPNLTRRGRSSDSRVLRIVSATFHWKDAKQQPKSLVVARNLMLAEAFSQYDDKKTCFLDVAKVGTPMLAANKDFLGPLCVGPGKVLVSANPDFDNKVYQELHYDGLRWVKVYGDVQARRGEKLVLWAAMKSGNYAFLMEYNFTDDGRIISRLGFTAHNFFDRAKIPFAKSVPHRMPSVKDGDVHAHFGCWRMDFDLSDPDAKTGGPKDNKILLVSRKFTDGKFGLTPKPFPGTDDATEPREGKAKWVATEFTTLRAESTTVKNGRGVPVAYDLISSRTGTAADLLAIGGTKTANMDFINYDYWVTRTPDVPKHYYKVPELAAGARPLAGERATVWHSVGSLHTPRDEDFGFGGVDAAKGAALTEWVGFTLRPRNLFDGTPLLAK